MRGVTFRECGAMTNDSKALELHSTALAEKTQKHSQSQTYAPSSLRI